MKKTQNLILLAAVLTAGSASAGDLDCKRLLPDGRFSYSEAMICHDVSDGKWPGFDKWSLESLLKKSGLPVEGPTPGAVRAAAAKDDALTQKFWALKRERAAALGIFDKVSSELTSEDGWRKCPASVFRECTVLAMSQRSNDPRGRMLDGVPAPQLFHSSEEGKIELLEAVAKAGLSFKELSNKEITQATNSIQSMKTAIQDSFREREAFRAGEGLAAFRALFLEMKGPEAVLGGILNPDTRDAAGNPASISGLGTKSLSDQLVTAESPKPADHKPSASQAR